MYTKLAGNSEGEGTISDIYTLAEIGLLQKLCEYELAG
jgi:hypothetical protein